LLLFFFQAEDGIRDFHVTGVQTCALPICTVSDHSLLTHLPGFRNALDDGGFLPSQVRSALHLVAAHERHRRVRLLGKAQRGWRRSEERRVGKECRYGWSSYR